MRNCRILLVVSLFGLAACSSGPKQAEQSPQPSTTIKAHANPTKASIPMNDPSVTDYIVKDISEALEGNTWRWGFDRPELRFDVSDTANRQLEVHFVIADATFKTTGPVTVNFLVNNRVAGTMKIAKAGDYTFTKPVPADFFQPDDFTDLAIEARPFWTSPTDGRHLSLILIKAGFSVANHA